jgi:hypothetical protein
VLARDGTTPLQGEWKQLIRTSRSMHPEPLVLDVGVHALFSDGVGSAGPISGRALRTAPRPPTRRHGDCCRCCSLPCVPAPIVQGFGPPVTHGTGTMLVFRRGRSFSLRPAVCCRASTNAVALQRPVLRGAHPNAERRARETISVAREEGRYRAGLRSRLRPPAATERRCCPATASAPSRGPRSCFRFQSFTSWVGRYLERACREGGGASRIGRTQLSLRPQDPQPAAPVRPCTTP